MKRSTIQQEVECAKQLLRNNGFALPPFAYWSTDEWKAKKESASAIIKTMRGWDVTDFGSGDFDRTGAILFTLRNGLPDRSAGCPYAEKLILMKEGQILPNHYHLQKTEDIISRGGGILMIQVFNSLSSGAVDTNNDVRVIVDGIESLVPAGTFVEIPTGSSMTVYPGLYHLFSVKQGTGTAIIGEVSSVNDDRTDNYFAEARPRFVPVEEDVPMLFPLCNEYDTLYR